MSDHGFVDVCIVGAGPAGCMAALGVLQRDPSLSVLLIDRHKEPAPRIGEALLTGTIMAFAQAGIAEEIAAAGYHPKIGGAYVWGENRDPWYVTYPAHLEGFPSCFIKDGQRTSIHVHRPVFDAHMRKIVAERGGKFLFGKVVTWKIAQDRVLSAKLDDGRVVRAREWIDASGQASVMGREVSERTRIWVPRVARYFYTKTIDWEMAESHGFHRQRTNIISEKAGWMWAIPLGDKGDHMTSVGVVTTPEVAKSLSWEGVLEHFPSLRKFGIASLAEADPLDPYGKQLATDDFIVHPDYSYACDRLHGANWSLVGDAAIFLDPILSQGVTLALHFGLRRGRAAADRLMGAEPAQERVTEDYRREAIVLQVIVGQWYSNNRSVSDWMMTGQQLQEAIGDGATDARSAFRYITNLENLEGDYAECEREVNLQILRHLVGEHATAQAAI